MMVKKDCIKLAKTEISGGDFQFFHMTGCEL